MTTKELIDKLEASLENLITLEIVTSVGTVSPTKRNKEGKREDPVPDLNAKLMRTRINLLEGDITTELDAEFVTGEYKELRTFHAAREQQAADIINRNIQAVAALIALIRGERAKPAAPGEGG